MIDFDSTKTVNVFEILCSKAVQSKFKPARQLGQHFNDIPRGPKSFIGRPDNRTNSIVDFVINLFNSLLLQVTWPGLLLPNVGSVCFAVNSVL